MNPEEKIAQRLKELTERSKGQLQGSSEQHAFGINVATLVRSLLGQNHPIVRTIDALIANYSADHSHRPSFPLNQVKGILAGIKSDFDGGYFTDIRTTIRSEVETDFLMQASRLLDEKSKDAAAMLIGAVLEDALRQLCQIHEVIEGDGIEKMNMPLKNAGVYGLPQQQQITAWAAIRNKAAH